MDQRFITYDEAVSLLNDSGETVHTFRQGGPMLIGADISKKSLFEIMKKHETTLQIGGDQCRKMKHGLVLIDDTGALFIECDTEKLDLFDPLPAKN